MDRQSDTVDNEDRYATWKQGVGIYVDGHDFGKGDNVEIEVTSHEVTDMRRLPYAGRAADRVATPTSTEMA